jgi:hypothetical protein
MATKPKRKPAAEPAARKKPAQAAKAKPMQKTSVPAKKPAQPVVPSVPQVKPPQRKQPANIGPFAQMVQSAIERIQEIANAFGKYEALVVVLVLVGIYCVKDATAANVWPICSLIVIGVMMPLVAGFLRKWRP